MSEDGAESDLALVTFPEGSIERIEAALGRDLFEFTINGSVDSLRDGTAPAAAMATTRDMNTVLTREFEGESNPVAWAEVLKGHLTDTSGSTAPEPPALTIRGECGGTDPLPTSKDPIEQLLIKLAVHAYPSFLLPDDPNIPFPKWVERVPFQATSALFRDPLNEQFEAEVAKDPVIAKVFVHTSEHGGPYAMVMASTGSVGSIQLKMLADRVFSAALRGSKPTLTEFVERVLLQWRRVYGVLAKKPATVTAQMSFAGVLLPGSGPYDFGDVQVRASTAAERQSAPESLSGQLTGTDSTGMNTVINYAGDVVAELQVPYEVRFSKQGLDTHPRPWPEDLLKLNPIGDVATRLRASLLLATEREHRVQIAVSWQRTDDILMHPRLGWSEPREFLGLMPTTLTADEVERWREWYKLLLAPDASRIQLAVSRVVRATGERRDPVDVLIDSVIAWENLFGTKDGEPTLRVTASLAILLESDVSKRRALRSELSKIYGLRSNAVHGTAMPKPAEVPLCFRALDVAIAAIRALLRDRPEVLAEPDGGARSLHLILGQEAVGDEEAVERKQ